MRFIRIVASQGLPSDYAPKPHHMLGYESYIAREFKRRILDINGKYHAKINIVVLP